MMQVYLLIRRVVFEDHDCVIVVYANRSEALEEAKRRTRDLPEGCYDYYWIDGKVVL